MKRTEDRVRALLDAARADDPGPSAKARVRAALSVQILGTAAAVHRVDAGSSAGSPTASAAAAKSPAIMVSLGKAVIAAVLTGVVGFAAGLSANQNTVNHSADSSVPSAPASSSAAPAPPATTTTAATLADSAPPGHSAPSAAPAGSAPASAPSRPKAAKAQRTPTGSKPAGTSGDAAAGAGGSALTAELALLREVQDALRASDTARAERWIAEHETRYPAGVLREEREAARVLLLCAKGRPAEARSAADRFLAESPRSVQADRVRGSCAFAGGPEKGSEP